MENKRRHNRLWKYVERQLFAIYYVLYWTYYKKNIFFKRIWAKCRLTKSSNDAVELDKNEPPYESSLIKERGHLAIVDGILIIYIFSVTIICAMALFPIVTIMHNYQILVLAATFVAIAIDLLFLPISKLNHYETLYFRFSHLPQRKRLMLVAKLLMLGCGVLIIFNFLFIRWVIIHL